MPRLPILLAVSLALAVPATAAEAPDLAGYYAKIALSCGGERLSTGLAAPDAEGRFAYAARGHVPYVRAISVDGAGRQTRTIGDDLVTGGTMAFTARRAGADLELDIDAEVSTLVEMRHFTLDDRTVDLPDVNRCAYKGKATARPEGDGWIVTGFTGPDGMAIDVVIRPGSL